VLPSLPTHLPAPLFNVVRVDAQIAVRLSAAGREGDQQDRFGAAATAAGDSPSNFRSLSLNSHIVTFFQLYFLRTSIN